MDKQFNLQDLLKFALQQKQSDDTTTSPQELNEENKAFLQSAFNEMTVDVIKEFQKAVETLENPSSSTQEILNALNGIRDYIDTTDFANNFVKIGGSKILITFLKSQADEVRVTATYIIAEMSQNNPFCQKHFVEANILPVLSSYLSEEKENVASSSLHAVSTLIRNFEQGLVEFLKLNGVQKLINCLSSPHTRVFIKSCFIIACLSSDNPIMRDEFVKKGSIAKLSLCIQPILGFDIKMETLLYALSELSKTTDRQHVLELTENKKDIQNIIEQNKYLPQCEEMVSYAKIVLDNMDCGD